MRTIQIIGIIPHINVHRALRSDSHTHKKNKTLYKYKRLCVPVHVRLRNNWPGVLRICQELEDEDEENYIVAYFFPQTCPFSIWMRRHTTTHTHTNLKMQYKYSATTVFSLPSWATEMPQRGQIELIKLLCPLPFYYIHITKINPVYNRRYAYAGIYSTSIFPYQ